MDVKTFKALQGLHELKRRTKKSKGFLGILNPDQEEMYIHMQMCTEASIKYKQHPAINLITDEAYTCFWRSVTRDFRTQSGEYLSLYGDPKTGEVLVFKSEKKGK